MAKPNKQIEIPYLLKIGCGKAERIGKYLADKSMVHIALYMGEGLAGLVDSTIRVGFAAQGIEILHVQTVDTVDVDDITHSAFSLPAVDAILGVGGGKAVDFAKYTAHLLRIPFISVPTAISNDGFGSSSASLTVLGKRKTVKAASPFGIVIDLDIIKNSPDIFIYSGLGDMVSKITALADWKAARDKGLARYVDFAAMMAYNSLDMVLHKHCYSIRDAAFQRSLANSLMISGLAMEMAGSSRPASGSEHLISHALDAVCERPQMHGIQVGIATYLCALLQGNKQTDNVRAALEETGFLAVVQEAPFNRGEFIAALEMAPSIKQDFYTVLSEPDSFSRAVDFITHDALLKKVVR